MAALSTLPENRNLESLDHLISVISETWPKSGVLKGPHPTSLSSEPNFVNFSLRHQIIMEEPDSFLAAIQVIYYDN